MKTKTNNKLLSNLIKFRDKSKYNVLTASGLHLNENAHSKIISSLVNPKEKHNQKDTFLKLFLEEIPNIDSNTFIEDDVIVTYQKKANKRFIDLAIEFTKSNSIVIIENKFLAEDQPNQLFDYYKFGKENYKNVYLLYLTINGHQPSENSIKKGDEKLITNQYTCISYEKNIINWLEKCIENSESNIKENIQIYIKAIRVAINRDKIFQYLIENTNEFNQLINIIKTDNNVDNVFLIELKQDLRINLFYNDRVRTHIYKQIIECFGDYFGEDFNPYFDAEGLVIATDEKILCTFCFEGQELYVKDQKTSKELIKLTLKSDNFENEVLIGLLINDKTKYKDWINDIYKSCN